MSLTKLSEAASFSVENDSSDAQRKIKFYYHDDNKAYSDLMVVLFPLSDPPTPPIEQAMRYDEEKKQWWVEIIRPKDVQEQFLIIPNVTPQDNLPTKQSAQPAQQGYLVLKNGEQQPVNKQTDIPAGELKKFLYTKDGRIEAAIDVHLLREGDRLITVYFPPGYNATRRSPYNFQITLDGQQYLEAMHMNVIYDNLIAAGEMAPVVNVFISPYTAAPQPDKPEMLPVLPAGYSLGERFREYSCNPEFSERLSRLPALMREQLFNITDDPQNTTIWGLSMGGLQAEYTALLYPEVFGNVVAQSPMAWNIPIQNGAAWRENITDDWMTSTAILPPTEQHNEYITQMLLAGADREISGRTIRVAQKTRFYFDAGGDERKYKPDTGFANLVASTEKFIVALTARGYQVLAHVIVPHGGHGAMTWMSNIPDAARKIFPLRQALKISPMLRGLFAPAWQTAATKTLVMPSSTIRGLNPIQLQEIMEQASIPGVSIATVDQDGIISTITRGNTNPTPDNPSLSTAKPAIPTTVFGAASLSKPVFAYLVLKLIAINKANEAEPGSGKFINLPASLTQFDLDTPLCDIIPPGTRYRGPEANALTAKMILSHQTGLPITHQGDGPVDFDFVPSTEFAYSGIPFVYLQEVIEALTGSTLEALAQQLVFKPLGMTHSSFYSPDDVIHAHASCSANSLFTTASDYACFISAWMHDKDLQYAFESHASMMKDGWAAREGVLEITRARTAWGLGFGLEVDPMRESLRSTKAYHTGDMGQWRAIVAMDLVKKTGIVCFTNSYNGSVLFDAVISKTIGLEHGLELFFGKFPFARNIAQLQPGWQEKPRYGDGMRDVKPRRIAVDRAEISETQRDAFASEPAASTESTYITPTPCSITLKPLGS